MNYIERLREAEKESNLLGLEPRLEIDYITTADDDEALNELCSIDLIQWLIDAFGLGDWADKCLTVTPHLFRLLQKLGIPCELVYGEVKINGTYEFDTTLDGLKDELDKGYSETGMAIHVWINFGANYIIDPTISGRIHKHYDEKCPQNIIFNGKSEALFNKKLKYIPMLAGIQYIKTTCRMPLEYEV